MATLEKKRPLGPAESIVPTYEPEVDGLGPVINDKKKRRDGRALKEIRTPYIKTGVIAQASGSAYLEMGHTKVMCGVYGPREAQRAAAFSTTGKLSCDVSYAPTARGALRSMMQENGEKELSSMFDNALSLSVQLDAYPKAKIDVRVTIIEDDGGADMAALTCASVALAHAGILMYDMVSGCTVSVIDGQVLSDCTSDERKWLSADVSLGIMLQLNKVCAMTQTGQMPIETVTKAVEQCLDSSTQVYMVMKEALANAVHDRMAADDNEPMQS